MNRVQKRYKLFWKLKSLRGRDGKEIKCNCVDLSENGMGIASHQQIKEKEIVSLTLGQMIPLETIWCKKLSKDSEFFYAGLKTIHPDENLLKTFKDFGIIKSITPDYCETKDGTKFLADDQLPQ